MLHGKGPLYVQIADHIRHQILDGSLTAGDQVMSTTQYSNAYNVNPHTANKSFTMLVDEGVLEKRRGIGMFVTNNAAKLLLREQRARYFTDVFEPALAQAKLLGINKEELLIRVQSLD